MVQLLAVLSTLPAPLLHPRSCREPWARARRSERSWRVVRTLSLLTSISGAVCTSFLLHFSTDSPAHCQVPPSLLSLTDACLVTRGGVRAFGGPGIGGKRRKFCLEDPGMASEVLVLRRIGLSTDEVPGYCSKSWTKPASPAVKMLMPPTAILCCYMYCILPNNFPIQFVLYPLYVINILILSVSHHTTC